MSSDAQQPSPRAAAVFGERLSIAARYADLLVSEGVDRGLVGPREAERIWDRHLLNCAAVAPLIDPGSKVCDVGSGAGLPGLVIAMLRPDVEMVLLEPMQRRTRFLEEAVQDLRLENVVVQRGRAEENAGRINADVVVARAVAPLERLAGWSLPLLRPGGQLLAMKGSAAGAELEQAASALRRLGAGEWELLELRPGGPGEEPTYVVRVLAGTATPTVRGGVRRAGGG